jgi:ankyrin repeat protein
MDLDLPSELYYVKIPAVMVAIDKGRQDIAIELLKVGAVTNGGTRSQHTALTAASVKNQHDVVNFILMNELEDVNRPATKAKPFNALGYAVALGHRELAHTLIEFGADPNFVSGHNGVSVMSEALSARDEYMIKLLIDSGYDLDAEKSLKPVPSR